MILDNLSRVFKTQNWLSAPAPDNAASKPPPRRPSRLCDLRHRMIIRSRLWAGTHALRWRLSPGIVGGWTG